MLWRLHCCPELQAGERDARRLPAGRRLSPAVPLHWRVVRKVLYWYLPLSAAVVAGALFVYGLVAFARGDVGAPVNVPNGSATTQSAPAPRAQVVPLILGDSLARGTGDETGLGIGGRLEGELKGRHIPARSATNLAVNGAKSRDLIALVEHANVRTLIAQSNVIVVSIGGNDLFGAGDWRSAVPQNPDAIMAGVLDNVASVVQTIRAANPKARVFLLGLYNPFVSTPAGPVLGRLVNRWNAGLISRFETDPNLTIVETSDIFSHHDRLSFDRFHPNQEGYAIIARRIADSV
jgi:lysophospholipase L1-like esterase